MMTTPQKSLRTLLPSPVVRARLLISACAAAVLFLVGCAAITESAVPIVPAFSSMAVAAAVLPDPRGTVVVEKVYCNRSDLPPDTATYLQQSLEKALAEHGLAPRPGADVHAVYGLSVSIKRAGGGGAERRLYSPHQLTDFVVQGVLRQIPGALHACDLSHRRSLYREASGTESLKHLLADVADDLVEELKVRLRGGGQIVQLHTIADRDEDDARPAVVPLNIRFYPLQDGRREKRRLGYAVPYPGYLREPLVADRRQVRDYLLETIRECLLGVGHQVVEEEEDVTVSGVLRLFWLWAESEERYWDVFAEVEFILELVDRKSGRSKSIPIVVRTKERVYVPPSAAVFEKVAGEAVSEMLNRVVANLVPSNLPH